MLSLFASATTASESPAWWSDGAPPGWVSSTVEVPADALTLQYSQSWSFLSTDATSQEHALGATEYTLAVAPFASSRGELYSVRAVLSAHQSFEGVLDAAGGASSGGAVGSLFVGFGGALASHAVYGAGGGGGGGGGPLETIRWHFDIVSELEVLAGDEAEQLGLATTSYDDPSARQCDGCPASVVGLCELVCGGGGAAPLSQLTWHADPTDEHPWSVATMFEYDTSAATFGSVSVQLAVNLSLTYTYRSNGNPWPPALPPSPPSPPEAPPSPVAPGAGDDCEGKRGGKGGGKGCGEGGKGGGGKGGGEEGEEEEGGDGSDDDEGASQPRGKGGGGSSGNAALMAGACVAAGIVLVLLGVVVWLVRSRHACLPPHLTSSERASPPHPNAVAMAPNCVWLTRVLFSCSLAQTRGRRPARPPAADEPRHAQPSDARCARASRDDGGATRRGRRAHGGRRGGDGEGLAMRDPLAGWFPPVQSVVIKPKPKPKPGSPRLGSSKIPSEAHGREREGTI